MKNDDRPKQDAPSVFEDWRAYLTWRNVLSVILCGPVSFWLLGIVTSGDNSDLRRIFAAVGLAVVIALGGLLWKQPKQHDDDDGSKSSNDE